MTVALSHGTDRAIITAIGAMTSLTAGDVPRALLRRSAAPACQLVLPAGAVARARAGRPARGSPGGRDDDVAGHQLGPGRALGRRPAARGARAHRPPAAERGRGTAPQRQPDTPGRCSGADQPWDPRSSSSSAPAARSAPTATTSSRIAPPAVPDHPMVVDATGAGDCFNAGLIAGLLRGMDLPSAARLGCAVGSASTRAAGGTAAAPTLAAALELADSAAVRPGWQ